MSNYIHNTASAKANSGTTGYVQNITEQTDGSLYVSFNRPGLFRFKQGEKPSQVFDHRKNQPGSTIAIHYRPGEFYYDMMRMPDTVSSLVTSSASANGWTYLTAFVNDHSNNFRKGLSPIGENEFLFSYSQKVFHIRAGQVIQEKVFDKEIIDVFADDEGSFWIGLLNGGVKRFLHGDLKSQPNNYLPNESVSGIIQDHERNYWFITPDNGIFQANSLNITIYNLGSKGSKENGIRSIASDNKNIYLGTETGVLLKGTELPNNTYQLDEIKLPISGGPIRKLFITPQKHLLIFNNRLLETDTLGHLKGLGMVNSYPFDYAEKNKNEWILSFTKLIVVYKNGKIIRRWDQNSLKKLYPEDSSLPAAMERVRVIHPGQDGELWLASQSAGLFSSKDSVIVRWSDRDSLFSHRIHSIVSVGKSIWVSIADYGIVIIKPDSSIARINQKSGLSSNTIDVLFAENDSIIWAGTNNGLNRITATNNSTKPYRIDYYTMREGLPSNRIFDIKMHKGILWVGTTRGLVQMSPGFVKPMEIPPMLIPGPLLVNGKIREISDTLILEPNENSLVFNFKAITYRTPYRIKYQYRLTGVDNSYISATGLDARYPDLDYGSYTFCINATYGDDFDPATEKTIFIQIKKHWYQTHMAWAVIGASLITLIFIAFRIIIKAVKKRESDKRQLLNAEKRSLLSQMNPHFIFNSLNSIQHFILQNDEIQANNYLTNFSGLIRKILDNSKKNLIPLQEEISTLSLYLSMEKLRFENNFEYQIIKDNRIDYNDTMIPPMLLQPFVENAIWHGLMPLTTKGTLSISFTDNTDFIHCRIEDNGIGRAKADQMKRNKQSHISSGIQNVMERIELLNRINKKKIQLTITDLHNSDGSASGTLVEIMLPFDLKF